MADVQAFIDAGTAAYQGNFDAAAASVTPAVQQEVAKATKPKPGDDCAAAAAKGAIGGAASGAGAGFLIAGPFGALIGAGVGALAGGLAAGAEGGCFASDIDWRAESRRAWAEAPYLRRVDVAGSALRKGEGWTMGPNAAEQRLMRFPVGKRGLTVGKYLFLMRRARELGGGASELRRIVGLVAPAPAVTPSTKQEDALRASKSYKSALASAEQLGATEAGQLLRNQLKNLRIAALMQGGFDRVEAERRVLGKPFGSSQIELTFLRKLISDAEPQASYVGPLRSIFGPRAALPATTRAGAAATESSPVLPIALGAAAVGAYFFFAK